ncbi:hypothetical protein ACH3VR_22570 [Microbacterium sp. B2969]|uniref:LysR substrate-binding domain-containing protein n=1 Tax=Microbacterium alkaliflavum TaxID=3248839 RepID=A0ABW7QIN2_9MICO
MTQDRPGARVRDAPITVQHFAALLPLLARRNDLIATIPDTIAQGWATDWPIVLRELPFEMSPIEIKLYCRNSSQHAGALDWFYGLVGQTIVGSLGEFASINVEPADASRA